MPDSQSPAAISYRNGCVWFGSGSADVLAQGAWSGRVALAASVVASGDPVVSVAATGDGGAAAVAAWAAWPEIAVAVAPTRPAATLCSGAASRMRRLRTPRMAAMVSVAMR